MGKLEKLCIKWLNENFNPMEPFYMEEYPDYIFHMKDGRCILQHNKKNGYVYVSYREIWKFFEHMFSMTNQQIKDITKIWVEEHYKMGVTTTSVNRYAWIDGVEEHYKMGVTTTSAFYGNANRWVEEQYKNEVTVTGTNWMVGIPQVEKQYKNEVKTTKGEVFWLDMKVEKQYQEIQTTDDQSHFYFEKDVEKLYE